MPRPVKNLNPNAGTNTPFVKLKQIERADTDQDYLVVSNKEKDGITRFLSVDDVLSPVAAKANTATSTANTASSKADTAASTANTASSKADTANQTASDAIEAANKAAAKADQLEASKQANITNSETAQISGNKIHALKSSFDIFDVTVAPNAGDVPQIEFLGATLVNADSIKLYKDGVLVRVYEAAEETGSVVVTKLSVNVVPGEVYTLEVFNQFFDIAPATTLPADGPVIE
jgi:hypothetical protein